MKKFLLPFLLAMMASCSTVPLTGRSQLSLIPSHSIQPLVEEEYQKSLTSNKILTKNEEGQDLVRVGKKMSIVVEKYLVEQGYGDLVKEFAWEFNLLENEQVNAWCMPGGKVAFYTGILPITQDETGIAVVMGHEIAHAVASHAKERMSTGLLLNLGVSAVDVAFGKNPTLTQAIFLQSVGIGSELKQLSFSRNHELEADRMGLIFMAMAGYDPRQAPIFWQRMAGDGKEETLEFLSTHPGPTRRIDRLNALLPEAMIYYEQAK